MAYPKRTETHRIDTLAVRRLMSSMPANWIVRDLSERDYGIDLMLEYFEGEEPTGRTVYMQVKGTSKKIEPKDGRVTFGNFPVSTLTYAECFPEPFLLVHLSTISGDPIYFTWLQKYISFELDSNEGKKWREQESTTIKIPERNNFASDEGIAHLERISSHNVILQSSLEFLTTHFHWSLAFHDFISGNFAHRETLLSYIKEFRKYKDLFEFLWDGQEGPKLDFSAANKDISDVRNIYQDSDMIDALKEFDEAVEAMAHTIHGRGGMEQMLDEALNMQPY